jgi:Tol biopolymer transport system component
MRTACLALVIGCHLLSGALGGEPPKIVPLTGEQIKAELAKETPAQKQLRDELSALAKAGQRIYFDANTSGKDRDIFAMGCDGSAVKQLTRDAGDNWYPHCSPDGKLVAFTSHRLVLEKGKPVPEALKGLPFDPKFPLPGSGKWDRSKPGTGVVWTMNAADGSDQKPVAFGAEPHWSPDGKFLAYCLNVYPEQLVIQNMEKRTEACFDHPAIRNCGMPCFSPDGEFVIGADGPAHCIKLNAAKNGVEKAFVFDRGHPCNGEVSPDGKWWVHVVDTSGDQGGWLFYREMDYEKPSGGGKRLNLGWKPNSVNYYPCFSPDGKYLTYVHAEQQPGVKSWELKHDQEIYVTRFPNCETTVRITWNGAGNQHPQWWGPLK